jgi:ferredoxin
LWKLYPKLPGGAIQVIDEKAGLISDLFCDGQDACVGECPTEAIKVVEREAEPYDERKVMENKIKRYNNNNWWGNQRVIRDKVLP